MTERTVLTLTERNNIMKPNKKIIRGDGIEGYHNTKLIYLNPEIQEAIKLADSKGQTSCITQRKGTGYLIGGQDIDVTYFWN